MGKGRYLLKRFIYIIFVFFIISILMFFIYKIMPGDPVTMMLGDAKANMKPDAYQRLYEQTRESLGLNSPLYVQYIRWIGNMLTGNFGYSTQYKTDVINMIGTPMLNTVMLNLVSMLVAATPCLTRRCRWSPLWATAFPALSSPCWPFSPSR